MDLRPLYVPLLLCALLGLTGCVPQALVTERYTPDFYEVARTLPDSLPGDTTRFLIVGDVQSGWRAERKFYRRENWMTWKQLLFPFYQAYLLGNGITGAINYKRGAPDYGDRERAMMRAALRAEAGRAKPDFWMILGDMAADDGRRADHWRRFLHEYRPLLDDYPLLPVLGNHERTNDTTYGGPNFDAVFDYGHFYVQDTPHMSLFVLDSNYLVDQGSMLDDDRQDRLFERWFVSSDTSTAPSWLERELERRKDRPFKVVAMHHPLLSYSWHSHDWYEAGHGRDLIEKRRRLLALLQRYGVQVVFSGHEHVYEHNRLRYERDGAEHVLHQVISSGGGVPPRPEASAAERRARQAQYTSEGYDVASVVQETAYHYTTVQATAGTLRIETFAVDPEEPGHPELLERLVVPAPAARGMPAE